MSGAKPRWEATGVARYTLRDGRFDGAILRKVSEPGPWLLEWGKLAQFFECTATFGDAEARLVEWAAEAGL